MAGTSGNQLLHQLGITKLNNGVCQCKAEPAQVSARTPPTQPSDNPSLCWKSGLLQRPHHNTFAVQQNECCLRAHKQDIVVSDRVRSEYFAVPAQQIFNESALLFQPHTVSTDCLQPQADAAGGRFIHQPACTPSDPSGFTAPPSSSWPSCPCSRCCRQTAWSASSPRTTISTAVVLFLSLLFLLP